MRARRTVEERDIVKILVFGYDRMLIKSIKDSVWIGNGMAHIPLMERKLININNIMNNIIENNDGVKRKVRVYDFGEKVADRYTIVCVSDRNKDSRGILFYPMFTCNENPSHPQGIGMYVGDYYPHKGGMYNLGRRVKDIMSLPKEVIRYIKWVTTT